MKFSILWALAWLEASGQFTSASHLAARSTLNNQPAVLPLTIQRRKLDISHAEHDRMRLRKRQLQLSLDNQVTLYFLNISIGEPPQRLQLHIDTGSSDIWTNSRSSPLCAQYARECAISGTYVANSSETYRFANSEFSIRYADGSYANGDYALDTITLGSTSIQNVPFGIGYNSTSIQGIFGIGYPANVALVGTTGQTYQNLPTIMAKTNIINTPAYSLWLNDLYADSGSILFGGVDSEKYSGSLQSLPIIKEDGIYREFVIALTELTANNQRIITTANPVPVLLDSGSSLTYLPTSYARQVFRALGASYNTEAGVAAIDCSRRNSNANVNFIFSGVSIAVPLSELVITEEIRRGREYCILGISDAGDSTAVLGDTFLRSAYVVYDMANNRISLAQTVYNATASNVQAITSGTNGIPGATIVPNAVTNLPVTPGGARGPHRLGGSSGSLITLSKVAQGLSIASALSVGILLAL